MTIQEFAQLYIDHGWKVVPLDKRAKKVSATGWMSIEFTAKDFRDGDNIGLKSIGNDLVFADLDSPECVAFGNAFVAETPSVYGRPLKTPLETDLQIDHSNGKDHRPQGFR